MGFLRRLLGGATGSDSRTTAPPASDAVATAGWTDDDEGAHELELARFEQSRTTNLMRRQQQYEDRSWTPPAQGGTKRAGGEEADA